MLGDFIVFGIFGKKRISTSTTAAMHAIGWYQISIIFLFQEGKNAYRKENLDLTSSTIYTIEKNNQRTDFLEK